MPFDIIISAELYLSKNSFVPAPGGVPGKDDPEDIIFEHL